MALRVVDMKLSKGSYTVTIHATSVSDGMKNKLVLKPIPQTSQKQDTGPAGTLVADLLRITRSFIVKGHLIDNSAKSDFIKIMEGGGIPGGEITLTYPDGGDSTSFTGYLDNHLITQNSSDEPDSPPDDHAKFTVQFTFIKGTKMAGT